SLAKRGRGRFGRSHYRRKDFFSVWLFFYNNEISLSHFVILVCYKRLRLNVALATARSVSVSE
ncbi:hypothetical protein, partial [Glaesserella sp.]|uniref:hypothetical protein n=1 Tax=Glaesserella sp. TaxID=2094731 RepID=UPI0035A039C3